MSQNITIREAKISELNQILRLYKDLHSKDEHLPDPNKIREVWNTIINNDLTKCLVLISEDKIRSTCILSIIPNLTRGGRPYGLIENVVTSKQYQRKGFGSYLLKSALDLSWKEDCYKVMLLTGRKDEKIFRFYEKTGFKKDIKTGFIAYP
ncbi:GNAT family N-acetyltransferase [Candidatus Woesearchaeota archaeon]|nr:GNAT family N-acetyltransferase [Candidatus Woesearchaeota archaeon]